MKGTLERTKGLTLIELAVVLFILGMMVLVTIPSIGRWLPRYRLRSAAREIVSNIQLAKLLAIKTSGNAVVSFLDVVVNDGVHDGTYDYIIFVDANGNWVYDDGTANFGKGINFATEYRNITFDGSLGDGGVSFPDTSGDGHPSFAFNAQGMPIREDTAFGGGTVRVQNPHDGRRIVIGAAGGIRIE